MFDFGILATRPLFFDGATGTMLQKYGLQSGTLGEAFNIERPNTVLRLHKGYLRAGADIIKTNTFSANPIKEKAIGYQIIDVVSEGVSLARQACDEMGKGYVALDIGPLGALLEPLGDISFEDAVAYFSKVISAGYKKADIVLIETMSDIYEMKAAILAAKESCNLPIFVTCTFDENGKMLCGADTDTFVAVAESLGVSALGINCGCGPERAKELVAKIAAVASVPVIANPNAGVPTLDGSLTEMSSKEFGYAIADIVAAGAQIVGGCCGTTPDHISSVYGACSHTAPNKVTDKNLTVTASYGKAVYLHKNPVMIGERINPTGKAKLKAALRENDIGYIVNEAIAQENAGADVLDVNVGLPDIDEEKTICEAIKAIQKISKLPLQIDTSNEKAMEAALRIYNGKPLVNSVNGSKESLLSVLPLVKKYGGAVIALTLDENGVPETVEERVKIAARIIKVAEACGIGRKNLVFDTLTMSAAACKGSAKVTLDTMNELQKRFGVRTVLGISNISFGLPERDTVTAAFLSEAIARGLSAAIMNPLSDAVRKAYLAHSALFGLDENCEKYIAYCSGNGKEKSAETLAEAISKGLSDKASELAEKLLSEKKPTEIIDSEIIPALNAVGADFESGKVYLPELLAAAGASEAAFEKLKSAIAASGEKTECKGKIVLATVKGDIHDLGKNIVKALLTNYGYDVIDLGKDVESEKIVDTVTSGKIRLVGLSALMTTTAPAMKDVVALLKEKAPDCKVMIGGAVITKEYADQIGAIYAKDAISSVNIANGVFGE